MPLVAPVSICMIVKNEEKQLEECLKLLRPYVAEICIVDTGSVDSTPDIARRYADKFETFTACNDQDGRITSFARARQRSYDLATQPWTMWVDGDDEVRGMDKLYDLIAKYDAERCGQPATVMLPYEYSHDSHGNVTCYHMRERLSAPPGKFHWHGVIHETLAPDGDAIFFQSEDIVFIHHRDDSGKIIEPGRNLRILKANYDVVGDSDIRQLYYLGLEYGYIGDIENSIKFHKKYVELSAWDDERFLSCLKIAECYQALGQYEEAVQWSTKSLTIREGWGEAYFNLGRSYYYIAQRTSNRRDWERSVHFFRQGLACPPTKTILFINPMERAYEIHKFLNLALSNIGDVDGAMESVETALKVRPDDTDLLSNKRIYEVHRAKSIISEASNKLAFLGEISGEARQVIHDAMSNRLPVLDMKRLDIVFYVGPGFEPWNPESVNGTGIGGSETAVVYMARLLSRKGHRVRVYGDCRSIGGIFDDVEYLHYDAYHDISCDVLITSRRPHAVDDGYRVRSRITLCWVHDVHFGEGLTATQSSRIDKFMCLSQWHKWYFLNKYQPAGLVKPEQVLVTRNGIDLSRFPSSGMARNAHRAVYSSSPDRGLATVLRIWPKIRKRVPDAELGVYYGFDNWEIAAASDAAQMTIIKNLRKSLKKSESIGVRYYGRTGQDQLAAEFLKSGVWVYPTDFSETSCITAMEAQAAGLKIVTSPIGALSETVGDRGIMISEGPGAKYQSEFVDAVCDAMLGGYDLDARDSLRQYAINHFGWESLADEWDEMLVAELKSKRNSSGL